MPGFGAHRKARDSCPPADLNRGGAFARTTIAVASMAFAPFALASEAFTSVRCSDDVAMALVGKTIPKGMVAEIERRYRDIGLRNEGGSEISKTLFLGGWTMCGMEYAVLTDQHDVIQDAIPFSRSRAQPGFFGACEGPGQVTLELVLAALDIPNPPGAMSHYAPSDKTLEAVILAWRVDGTRRRFVKLLERPLRCPRNGIFTADGGP